MRDAFVEGILHSSIPLGITSAAGMLRHGGHEVEVFVADKLERTLDEANAFAPDTVGFSVISRSHRGYYAIARSLKEHLAVPTIWGGPHPTFFPEITELPWIDAVCIGEDEEATLKSADAFDAVRKERCLSMCRTSGLKRDGKIYRNRIFPRNRALDDLPYPPVISTTTSSRSCGSMGSSTSWRIGVVHISARTASTRATTRSTVNRQDRRSSTRGRPST
jgi:anaerobic magnesium-protoporphyrin IX monomethyl ester cyclase